METLTHAQLVERAVKWLKGHGYPVAFGELRCMSWEEADALGLSGEFSCLIECKTSRADFLADAKKPFRRRPEMGMGTYRYMLAPKDLLSPDEMPEGWGLLEVRGNRTYEIKKPVAFDRAQAAQRERAWVFSLLRRVALEEPGLLEAVVDCGKAKTRVEVKSIRLANEEHRLKAQEDRLAFRKSLLKKAQA